MDREELENRIDELYIAYSVKKVVAWGGLFSSMLGLSLYPFIERGADFPVCCIGPLAIAFVAFHSSYTSNYREIKQLEQQLAKHKNSA